jgi:hypothetical protein
MGSAMLKWLKDTFASIFRPFGTYRVERAEDLPDTCNPNTLYVVGEGGHDWYAAFLCPCGCKETIQLNLQPDSRPLWRLYLHWNGTATLHPSVNRIRGCRSHFWLRKGRIQWCKDDLRRNPDEH